MDDLSLRFNKLMMQEMGFEVGARQRLYDQDTGALVQFDGKDFVAPGSASGKEAQEFDPYNSTKIMAQMFSYYTDKLVQCGEAPEYDVIYSVDCDQGKGRVEMKSDSHLMKSGVYLRDQCKYADLVLQLNGDMNPRETLKEFDIPKAKDSVKPVKSAPKKKDGGKKKNA